MATASSSSTALAASSSSSPYARRTPRRLHRPSPFMLSECGPYTLQRYYTDPAQTGHRAPFDIAPVDFDAIDGAFDVVPYTMATTRPSSPTPTADFSIISPPSPGADFDFDLSSRRHARFHTVHGTPGSRSSRGTLSRIWDALASPSRRHRGRPGAQFIFDPHMSYADLPPLDGEEGELIEDEACFVGHVAPTGVDIVSRLPCELGIYILRHLDLASVLTCMRVSRTWHGLADDNAVWREMFFRREGWRVNLSRAQARGWAPECATNHRATNPVPGEDYFSLPAGFDAHARRSLPLMQRDSPYATPQFMTPAPPSPALFGPSPYSPERPLSVLTEGHAPPDAPLALGWRGLYRARRALDARWAAPGFAPRKTRISGHANSVYCVAFDSARIVTGARDHTVRVWRLADGACAGVLRAHVGSVLCLRFEEDWDLRADEGLLCTGSSDHTVRVWSLRVVPGGAVAGRVRGVLGGHAGGVLDVRFDARWVASSSKDATIRVWDRRTLQHLRTLAAHDGPVNSIAMQAGRLVSASGDGRIIYWDMERGEVLRVLDHTRGHACVDYQGDTIVSGSNDSNIKVWSAATGECLRTLTGHTDLVRALAFDPASGRLVSASYDMSVRVWDLRTGRPVREFLRHQGSHILDVKFDCCKIVSVSYDKTILVTDFSEGLDTALFA